MYLEPYGASSYKVASVDSAITCDTDDRFLGKRGNHRLGLACKLLCGTKAGERMLVSALTYLSDAGEQRISYEMLANYA